MTFELARPRQPAPTVVQGLRSASGSTGRARAGAAGVRRADARTAGTRGADRRERIDQARRIDRGPRVGQGRRAREQRNAIGVARRREHRLARMRDDAVAGPAFAPWARRATETGFAQSQSIA
jgi:hypothetical protein